MMIINNLDRHLVIVAETDSFIDLELLFPTMLENIHIILLIFRYWLGHIAAVFRISVNHQASILRAS
jgi:hypothetical protein